MERFRRVAFSLVLFLTLGAVACGVNDVITALDLSIDAAAAGLPLLAQLSNMPPALQEQLKAGFDAALADGAQATDILLGPGTDAAKYSALVALYSNVALPFVPDQYQAEARAAKGLAKLISDFLGKLRPSDAISVTVPAKTSFLPPAHKGTKTTRMNEEQKRKLAAIKAKATAARQKK